MAMTIRDGDLTEMTCALDGRAHLVEQTDLERGTVAGQGWFPSVCGHRVIVASLASPAGPRCGACTGSAGTHPRPARTLRELLALLQQNPHVSPPARVCGRIAR